MVYKSIDNTASFVSALGGYTGSDNAVVEMEDDEYTFEKTADPSPWSGVDPLSYTITLTADTGSAELADITVTDILPNEVTFDNTSVEIDGVATTTNFTVTGQSIEFGTETPLSVREDKDLIITFQVTKNP